MTKTTTTAAKRSRIGLLDAYRTLAILWVGLFHYAYFWTSVGKGDALLPYDAAIAWIPFSSVGFLGVTLFFLISGYVISLTLQTTATFNEFAVKRFARLWPTLLVCGAITYGVVTLLGPPELKVSLPEALISMTLIPPQHVGSAIGAEGWKWLDGAYWSLWVELRFYIIIGLAFYIFRKSWLTVWLAFEALGWAVSAATLINSSGALGMLDGALFGAHTPYFTLGILACRYKKNQTTMIDRYALVFALSHSIFNIATSGSAQNVTFALVIGYAIVFGLFAIFVWRPRILAWMEHKLILRIGRASYSFYLLHQAVGITLLIVVASAFGATGALIALPIIIMCLLVLSSLIFERIEQPANRWIVSRYKAFKAQSEIRKATNAVITPSSREP